MLETLMKLYVMAMATGVTSPLPHLFGPPGCGKSTAAEQLAELLGVNLHIINVARLSPLEVEGVQMPHGDGEDMALRMLPATFWSALHDGDIVLLDEFLRGFPEVYNALLDILTSRRAGAFRLPKVFILGASNSTVSYDKALEDRLLHLPVPDPRKRKGAKRQLATLIVERLGLLPEMIDSYEMQTLLDTEVLPMFEVLDSLGKASASPALVKGNSVRNLIGQALLREVQSTALAELLDINNQRAASKGKFQYVFLVSGKLPPSGQMANYQAKAELLRGNERLTEIQAQNLELNLQLIQLEAVRNEKEGTTTDDDDIDDEIFA